MNKVTVEKLGILPFYFDFILKIWTLGKSAFLLLKFVPLQFSPRILTYINLYAIFFSI